MPIPLHQRQCCHALTPPEVAVATSDPLQHAAVFHFLASSAYPTFRCQAPVFFFARARPPCPLSPRALSDALLAAVPTSLEPHPGGLLGVRERLNPLRQNPER